MCKPHPLGCAEGIEGMLSSGMATFRVFFPLLVRSNYTSFPMKGICFHSLCALWLWTRSLPLGASVFCVTFNEESGAYFVFIIYA